MKRTLSTVLIAAFAVIVALSAPQSAKACTSAIFTGKCTPDGRPLLWKHRDTGSLENRIEYFAAGKDRKYSFIGLVNSLKDESDVWTGTNEVGFSIMNTASYNLQEKKANIEDQEGVVMYQALGCCKTLADFEKLLDKMKKPLGVEANFGVIDAEGGAAYYEVNNYKWTKIDVNDPKIAPEGFLVYTNHSYTGELNEGSGYIRYATANNIVYKRWIQGGEFTPQWIFNNLSRSYYNSLLDLDLAQTPEAVPSGWFIDQDFIPRRSTSASIVVKGVKPGENPELTVMWTILGYPPCGVAVPLFAKAGAKQPAVMMKSEDSKTCKMDEECLARRAQVFSNKRSNAKNYFNFGLAMHYMHALAPAENINFFNTEAFMDKQYEKGTIDPEDLQYLYGTLKFGEIVK